MKETVLYLFVRGQEVLIEFRITDTGKYERLLIPGGGIEVFDRDGEGDYKEKAMHREIHEELSGQVKAISYHYKGSVNWEEDGNPFHIFLITEWAGQHPEYIVENGMNEGKLVWLNVDEAIRRMPDNVTSSALLEAKKHVTS